MNSALTFSQSFDGGFSQTTDISNKKSANSYVNSSESKEEVQENLRPLAVVSHKQLETTKNTTPYLLFMFEVGMYP